MAQAKTRAVTAIPDSASPVQASVSGVSIGDYLIRRLQDYGVRDVFGIPGDYVLFVLRQAGGESYRHRRLHQRGLRRFRRPMPTPESTAWEPSALRTAWAG